MKKSAYTIRSWHLFHQKTQHVLGSAIVCQLSHDFPAAVIKRRLAYILRSFRLLRRNSWSHIRLGSTKNYWSLCDKQFHGKNSSMPRFRNLNIYTLYIYRHLNHALEKDTLLKCWNTALLQTLIRIYTRQFGLHKYKIIVSSSCHRWYSPSPTWWTKT